MNISELSLKRPVLAIVMNLAIIIFGLVGFLLINTFQFPRGTALVGGLVLFTMIIYCTRHFKSALSL
jgi:multidrug efflux pump subunit AcrB